jgi:hypothetical protein
LFEKKSSEGRWACGKNFTAVSFGISNSRLKNYPYNLVSATHLVTHKTKMPAL